MPMGRMVQPPLVTYELRLRCIFRCPRAHGRSLPFRSLRRHGPGLGQGHLPNTPHRVGMDSSGAAPHHPSVPPAAKEHRLDPLPAAVHSSVVNLYSWHGMFCIGEGHQVGISFSCFYACHAKILSLASRPLIILFASFKTTLKKYSPAPARLQETLSFIVQLAKADWWGCSGMRAQLDIPPIIEEGPPDPHLGPRLPACHISHI